MYKFLFDLEEAFYNVPIDYTNNRVARATVQVVNENHIQRIERPFMTELYHQWRLIMINNPSRYNGLILHATIGKLIDGDNVEFPDLALHGGQVGPNRNRNEVMVEIKMENYDANDMRKLFNAVSGKLSYKKGVYIVFNKTFDQIKISVNNDFANIQNFEASFRKIFFLTKKDGLFNLNDLM